MDSGVAIGETVVVGGNQKTVVLYDFVSIRKIVNAYNALLMADKMSKINRIVRNPMEGQLSFHFLKYHEKTAVNFFYYFQCRSYLCTKARLIGNNMLTTRWTLRWTLKLSIQGKQELVYIIIHTLKEKCIILFNNAFQPGSEMDARLHSIKDLTEEW
jgi:hypothetical protein